MDELLASIRRIIAEEDLSVAMTPRPSPADLLPAEPRPSAPPQMWAPPPAPSGRPADDYGDRYDAWERSPEPAPASHAAFYPPPREAEQPPRAESLHMPRREAPLPRSTAAEPAWSPARPEPARAAPAESMRGEPRRDEMRQREMPRAAAAPRADGRARSVSEPRQDTSSPAAARPQEATRHHADPAARGASAPAGGGYRESMSRPSEPIYAAPPRAVRREGEDRGPASRAAVSRAPAERQEGWSGHVPGAAAAAAPAPRKDLLGPGADAALSAAFHALGDLAVPGQPRTVEDLVKEILRPMLKDWLDQNLPALVEDLVRAEIERVSPRTRRG